VIVGADLDAGREVATRHGASALNASADLLCDRGESAVAAAQDDGLAVNAWTVREWETARDCIEIGVDGLIADYPFLDATL
jgi:glycerophosphoryl diester phosphodiesterase